MHDICVNVGHADIYILLIFVTEIVLVLETFLNSIEILYIYVHKVISLGGISVYAKLLIFSISGLSKYIICTILLLEKLIYIYIYVYIFFKIDVRKKYFYYIYSKLLQDVICHTLNKHTF